jgi:hypothetical protein
MKKILIVLFLVGVIAYVKLNPKILTSEPVPGGNGVACTEEAKQCPDGSYVGRTGPKCEFSECPTVSSEPVKKPAVSSMVAGLNQKIYLGGGIYVTPLEVLSDSRCPVDVQCIWAGEIVLKIKLEKDMRSKEVEIKEGESVDAGPGLVSLVDVTPENNTKKPFTDKDYKFTFKVSWKLD